jgi:hypothetical protein
MKRLGATLSFLDSKIKQKTRHAEEKVVEIGARLQTSLRNSWCSLHSKWVCCHPHHKVKQNLHLYLYKTTVVHKLQHK